MATAGRTARKWLIDQLQTRMLGEVLTTLGDHEIRIRRQEATMSALIDYVRDFRTQADAETSRVAGILADLQNRLDTEDQAEVDAVRAELTPVIDGLKAMGTGGQADPLPAPPAGVPTDDSGQPVDTGAGAGDTMGQL